MKKSFPNILILGSRYDFTCDYVVAQLRKLGTLYLRLNSEDLGAQEVVLEPKQGTLNVLIDNAHYCLNQGSLKSIYYRRPVFLREYDSTKHDPIEQFQRYQWAAFMRNLMLFNECLWVNHPTATYYAEHKAVQLHTAFKIGFDVPDTLITNQFSSLDTKVIRDGKVTIKGLDTVLVRNKGTETFGFANIVSLDNTTDDVINSAPALFQMPLLEKTDVRVTVIGSEVFAVSILQDGKPIQGDWRLQKSGACFVPIALPEKVKENCLELLNTLGLRYGAIDLAIEKEKYYFLEINPTGEWAWLVDAAKLPI